MSYPYVFTWPAPDTQAVCLTQTLGAAGNLTLNGHLTVNSTQPGDVKFPGIARTVSLTSTNNLSAVNFTVTGYLNGVLVSDVDAGPNNNTVYTTQVFDQVINVHADAAAAAVSIGTGTTGYTQWYNFDYNRSYPVVSLAAGVTGTINYTLQATLDNVGTTSSPLIFNPIAGMTAATTTQFGSLTVPYSYLNFKINSSTNGALAVTILQQGI